MALLVKEGSRCFSEEHCNAMRLPPNQPRHPTPGERLGSHLMRSARRGCTLRWAPFRTTR
jgi:hypothetical protein